MGEAREAGLVHDDVQLVEQKLASLETKAARQQLIREELQRARWGTDAQILREALQAAREAKLPGDEVEAAQSQGCSCTHCSSGCCRSLWTSSGRIDAGKTDTPLVGGREVAARSGRQ